MEKSETNGEVSGGGRGVLLVSVGVGTHRVRGEERASCISVHTERVFPMCFSANQELLKMEQL